DGVRFHEFRGQTGVLVAELEPGVRTVRWIKDGQGEDYGEDAHYENRSLALPYIVLVMPFFKGVLQTSTSSGCQVYYRRDPLGGWDDELLMTNLLNVAHGYDYTSWVCMVGYQQKQGLTWQQAVEEGIRYFFWSAFNRSSEVHEQNSHYSSARQLLGDRRISSAVFWETASVKDPKFMLEIPWPDTGYTVRSAVGLAFSKMAQQKLNLVNLMQGS
ncbi:MAG: hypothetical protein Q8P12_04805, partial [bacterium]|nr:hypothetical protein [bacterium]